MQTHNLKNKILKVKKHSSRVFSKLLSFKASKLDSGFTLLFASLIGSLMFTIGIAILNISLKQITLASAGRESQQAFYSADAGIECALLLDRGAGDPNCPSGFFGTASSTASSGITICDQDSTDYTRSSYQKCFGQDVTMQSPTAISGGGVQSGFAITSNPDTDICFNIVVTKVPDPNNSNGVNSIIESRGYSTCRTGDNVFERAIKTYNY